MASPALLAQTQARPDHKQEVQMALDQYGAAKTGAQRAAAVEYLQHFDRKLVSAALIDHILAAKNGTEATGYSSLIEVLSPDACVAVLDRLEITDTALEKGKLVVALRHCQGDDTLHTLAGCLDDQRPVAFESKTSHPRRVCDFAYDELYLKLRNDPTYGFDPTPAMRGIITESTPTKTRDAVISALKAKLAPGPTVPPVKSGTGRPETAAL